MNTQTKAVIGAVVVLMLALATVSGVTYSWWSDSESGTVTVETGYLDVSTSNFKIGSDFVGTGVPDDISLKYVSSTTSGWNATDSTYYIPQTTDPDDLDLAITYTVTFKASVYAAYMINVSLPEGIDAESKVYTDSTMNTEASNITLGQYSTYTGSTTELDETYYVSITVESLDMGISEAKIHIQNEITQNSNPGKVQPAIASQTVSVDTTSTSGSGTATISSGSQSITATGTGLSSAATFTADVSADTSTGTATITLDAADSNGEAVFTTADSGSVTVTAKLAGKYTGVVYNGTELSQPSGVTCSYDSATGITTITFTTTHFSEFVAYDEVFPVYTENDLKVAAAAGLLSLILMDDITISTSYLFVADSSTVTHNGYLMYRADGVTVDLNQKKIVGEALNIEVGYVADSAGKDWGSLTDESSIKSSLIIKNGTVDVGSNTPSKSCLSVGVSSTLSFDHVDVKSSGAAIFPNGDGATFELVDSTITSTGAYAIATNASRDSNGGVVIDVVDSTIRYDNPKESEFTAIMINTPDTKLSINGSNVSGTRQALVVRAGTATVTDSTLICDLSCNYTDGERNTLNVEGLNIDWQDGNRVPEYPVVLGDTSANAYNGDASLTLEDVTILNTCEDSDYSGRYIYIADDNTHSATLTIKSSVTVGSSADSAKAISASDIISDNRDDRNSHITVNGVDGWTKTTSDSTETGSSVSSE